MAAKTSSGSQDFRHRFRSMLYYACGELCVIILLYVATLASYASTRLARICGLKAPCILCMTLDRTLHGKVWFSADLVCNVHRSEISSLTYCKSHDHLSYSDDICKTCLLACKVVGVSEELNSQSISSSRRLCSCCSKPFKNTCNVQNSETTNVVETNWRSQFYATDNIFATTPKVVPEQVPADHPEGKTFVVGIEEVHESDGSPDSHGQSRKNSGSSASCGVAKPVNYRSVAPTHIAVDRNGSVKNAFVARVNLTSPRPSEIISARDMNSTTQQDVKALLSQISSARGFDSSSSEGTPSPGINTQTEERNSTSKRPSLERNYSVLEPSDGSLTDDAEGESSLENVKKQFELNKKSMAALYKELEEERSASAVAVSQTMAMINRLQEEKAAMQMEALQYLRMMEEQADHDHEAIQNLHDLLTEREKELLDLDAELTNCRSLLQNEPFNDGRFNATNTMNDDRNLAFEFLNGMDFVRSTMSHFEDEKAYILESLIRLEENLGISTNRLASGDVRNSQEDILFEDQTRANGQDRETSQLDGQEHMIGKSTSIQQLEEHDMVEENKNKCSCSSQSNNLSGEAGLKAEISLVNTRLRALEADQEFLKQVLSSLQCGSDGLQCIQEITSYLAELRRVMIQ